MPSLKVSLGSASIPKTLKLNAAKSSAKESQKQEGRGAFMKGMLRAPNVSMMTSFRSEILDPIFAGTHKNEDRAFITFEEHRNDDVNRWPRTNIEDEWSWGGWNIDIEFKWWNLFGQIPYIVFKPGVTANVNGPGGNKITMDGNKERENPSSSWTIRHEFGHVLGFPDCYLEFFVEEESPIHRISYVPGVNDYKKSTSNN